MSVSIYKRDRVPGVGWKVFFSVDNIMNQSSTCIYGESISWFLRNVDLFRAFV